MVMYFFLGFVCGFAMMFMIASLRSEYDRQRKAKDHKPTQEFFSRLLSRDPRQPPEPPKDYAATPIRRTPANWRHKKAELERQHNSKQKERDQRVAGL